MALFSILCRAVGCKHNVTGDSIPEEPMCGKDGSVSVGDMEMDDAGRCVHFCLKEARQ